MQESPALDITSLEQAIDRLSEGWTRYQQDTSDVQIRDGLVQRFEFTYEISHKMLKRYLVMTSPSPANYLSSRRQREPSTGLMLSGQTHARLPWILALRHCLRMASEWDYKPGSE